MIRRLPVALVSSAIALGVVTGCEQIPGFADQSKQDDSKTSDQTPKSAEPTPRPDHLRYLHDIEAKFDNGLNIQVTPLFNIPTAQETTSLIEGHFLFHRKMGSSDINEMGYFIAETPKDSKEARLHFIHSYKDFDEVTQAPVSGWDAFGFGGGQNRIKITNQGTYLVKAHLSALNEVYYLKFRFTDLSSERVLFDFVWNKKSGDRQL